MSNVVLTGKISLAIQFGVGVLDTFALSLPRSKNVLLRDLLKLELLVQVVEFVFYSWMVYTWGKYGLQNIIRFRYYDWMLTTPSMLVTLMAFLGASPSQTLGSFVAEHKDFITGIISLNFSMLLLGLSGEFQCVTQNQSVLLGFIPFVLYFGLIYNRFIADKNLPQTKVGLFYYYFMVWSLYGLVALLPPVPKNIGYNILDLFSKNLLGIVLSSMLISQPNS
jgi:bacteriorhodopsin